MPRVNTPNHIRSCWLKNESWLICLKLTRNLPHGRDCLCWSWQVPTTIPWGEVQVRVNVPNHVRSHRPWMMHHPSKGKTGRTLVSTLFPWKTELRLICSKLTRDLPHGGSCLPWRWQVPTTIIWGVVQVQVNVPNYVWSCQLCTILMNLGELCCSAPLLKFPWKLNLGRSAWNSQGTCPWPRTTFPEDGKSLALSSEEQARHE